MSAPERTSGGPEAPIRVFRYPDGGWRKVVVDLCAAIAVAIVCAVFAVGEPFLIMLPVLSISTLACCYASISYRLRKYQCIRLYRDRIDWDTIRGVRTVKLKELGQAKKTGWGDQGRAIVLQTYQGNLILPENMDGFGDLAQRIEESKYGWMDRSLARSTAKWTGPDVFRYRGFIRFNAGMKLFGAVAALIGAAMMSSIADSLAFLGVASAFLGLAILDARQFQNARIERVGSRLVQFDRWNHPVASVDIATLQFISTHENGHRIEGRIYGEDGVLQYGNNLENTLALVEAVYTALADRYRAPKEITQEESVLLPNRP